MKSLNAVRMVLSLSVVIAHLGQLSGFDVYWLGPLSRSDLAVQGFFVLSGYLIFRSYEGSSNVMQFFERRARRLFPAYAVVVLFGCAAGLLLTKNELKVSQATAVFEYLIYNIIFLNFMRPDIPGLFQDNIHHAVNGSLWTLKIEVAFYFSVPLIAFLFSRLGTARIILSIWCLSLLYILLVYALAGQFEFIEARAPELIRQYPGQIRYFMAGAAIFYFQDALLRHPIALAAIAVILIMIDPLVKSPLLSPILIGILLILIIKIDLSVDRYLRFDASYGTYLFHFPLIQLANQFGLMKDHPYIGSICLVGLSVLAGIASWQFIERPFIKRPPPGTLDGGGQMRLRSQQAE